MSSTRRTVWALILLLVAIAVGVLWVLRRGPSGAAPGAPAAERSAALPAAATGVGHSIEAVVSQDAADSRSTARAKRDALRAQILRQLAQRPAPSGGAPSAAAAGSSSEPASGGLRNRLDELHQPVVDQVNRDFMPLASECVEQAQARLPQLAGMITLSMEMVADEQLGAVVDVADPAPSNQIGDPPLFECLRESAFSLTLPPPPTGGRMKVMITLRVDPPSGR
ncbi:MAG TPA: hypothetical protein VHT91_50585 [Kofleriaceae bacterium]|nr:hypothetical protein [Kofleriaceae bacterium]